MALPEKLNNQGEAKIKTPRNGGDIIFLFPPQSIRSPWEEARDQVMLSKRETKHNSLETTWEGARAAAVGNLKRKPLAEIVRDIFRSGK